MAITLSGTIRGQGQAPLPAARLKLYGSRDDVGAVERAAVEPPGEVRWEPRDLGDFRGSRWNCWQRFVMNHVAGLTWDEFREQVVARNPRLAEEGMVFRPGTAYLLPAPAEEVAAALTIAWTRPLTGFAGNRWGCWQQFVQGRVTTLSWDEFKEEAAARNPALAQDGYLFRAAKSYLLPELVVAAPGLTWTRSLTGFAGNRWEAWEQHVSGAVQGLTWAEFKDQVVAHNPDLAADGYLLRAAKTYLLPENGPEPRYYLAASSDAEGSYRFEGLGPGTYQLVAEAEGYHRYTSVVTLAADAAHDIALLWAGPAMVSDWSGYPTAAEGVRKLIDQALRMLGDDATVYDSLPPDLVKLAWGRFFLNDPNHFHYKDIVCADLVTICLVAAGASVLGWTVEDPTGIGYTSTHAANYYRPSDDHPYLREPEEDEPWLPGDIIIYGDRDLAVDRVEHVDVYVGPFHGVDLSGNVYPAERGYDVVNASIDYMSGGQEIGTAIKPFTLDYCQTKRFGFKWWRRVRHKEVEAMLA